MNQEKKDTRRQILKEEEEEEEEEDYQEETHHDSFFQLFYRRAVQTLRENVIRPFFIGFSGSLGVGFGYSFYQYLIKANWSPFFDKFLAQQTVKN